MVLLICDSREESYAVLEATASLLSHWELIGHFLVGLHNVSDSDGRNKEDAFARHNENVNKYICVSKVSGAEALNPPKK